MHIYTDFFSPVVFGSILDLRPIQSLGPGTPSSVMAGVTLVAWISGWPLTQSLCHPYPSRKDHRSKVEWLGWCPNSSTGSLALVTGDGQFRLLLGVSANIIPL